MIQLNPIQSLVGLARKAGKVTIGQQAVSAIAKKKQTNIIILANDASQHTKNLFQKPAYHKIDLFEIGSKKEWGHLFGRESVAVIAVSDKGFARAIRTEIRKRSKTSTA